MAIYDYRTCELTNFSDQENQKAYQEGLLKVRGYLGKKYPLIINGERIFTDRLVKSLNPSNHKEVIGEISSSRT